LLFTYNTYTRTHTHTLFIYLYYSSPPPIHRLFFFDYSYFFYVFYLCFTHAAYTLTDGCHHVGSVNTREHPVEETPSGIFHSQSTRNLLTLGQSTPDRIPFACSRSRANYLQPLLLIPIARVFQSRSQSNSESQLGASSRHHIRKVVV
jgi:hypothetical protein